MTKQQKRALAKRRNTRQQMTVKVNKLIASHSDGVVALSSLKLHELYYFLNNFGSVYGEPLFEAVTKEYQERIFLLLRKDA